jgi:hypothetical protein
MCVKCNRSTHGCDRVVLREKKGKIEKTMHSECAFDERWDADAYAVHVETTTRLGEVPDGYICPLCGEESLSPIVDGSQFLRFGDFQATGIFSEEGRTEEQPVRLYCDGCDACIPITAALAEKLVDEAEKG